MAPRVDLTKERERARERERERESTYMVDGLPVGFDVWVGVFVCVDTYMVCLCVWTHI